MDEIQKGQYARDWRDMCLENANISMKRAAELESEYTRLEVQIAAILFAFSGVFIDKFSVFADKFSPLIYGGVKSIYAVAVFMLLVSLAMGLLHLKRTAKFWEGFLELRNARMMKWNDAVLGNTSFEDALSFHQGASLGKIGIAYSPTWTWVLQTISLGVAVGLFFVIFLIFLFQ